VASKNAKQVENIVKELGRTGKSLEKALGLFEGAVAAETKAAMLMINSKH
jgi:exonuclease VII small subunit